MSRSLRRTASLWLVRLQSDDAGDDDRCAFLAWYGADARHASAFDAVASAVENVRALRGMLTLGSTAAPSPRRQVSRTMLAGACLAVASAAAAGVLFLPWREPLRFETARGEHQKIVLDDGSRMELNTGTSLQVRMGQTRRRIIMEQGEALFAVAHDPDRPFEVEAGGRMVRAVGTSFDVRIEDDEALEVLVTEGVVLVDRDSRRNEARMRVAAGNQLSLTRAAAVLAPVTSSDVARALAWRAGMLQFDREPLSEVVREVARHTGARFQFADPTLEGVEVVAYFPASDVEAFVAMLETSYPMLAVRATAGGYRIERREEQTR